MLYLEERIVKARKLYIAHQFPGLNDMQLKAVMATEGPLLVLAGAGSGKTTVLINRIANLIKYGRASDSNEIHYAPSIDVCESIERGENVVNSYISVGPVDPWRILAITFTNKAAGEIKDRLSAMLGEIAEDIWACTFHSACVRILRREAEKIGYVKNFVIYDTSDCQSLIKQILKDYNLDDKIFAPKTVLSEISRAKDSLLSSEEYCEQAESVNDIRKKKIGEIYKEYSRRMFSSDAMDFDDLIYLTVRILKTDEDVRHYWQNRFKYILIDEYQDTNNMQYELASILAEKHKNICVVGDDDQSIYAFRGATIENILSFEDEYKLCRTIRLEQNYRSTGHILNAANAVIRKNTGRKSKELWTNRDNGSPLTLYVSESETEEAGYVASKIFSSYGRGGNWSDNAVLYRMNAQSNQIEYALKRNGIPYRIYGGIRFFDRSEIKDVLAYMSVIAQRDDTVRLTRIINSPPRGIGQKSIEMALGIASKSSSSLFDVVSNAYKYPELKRATDKMMKFSEMINALHSYSLENTPDLLFDELMEKTGYLQMYENKNTIEDTSRAENIKELKSSIIAFIKESGETSLDAYLANVALYTDLDNYDRSSDCVTLMTMHSAKGLEFPNVYVVGMEETIFPGLKAIGSETEMEEERRLCYVALTRAMNELTLVCAKRRMLFGKTTANRVSRFIDDIPENCIEKNIPKGYGYREASRYESSYYSKRSITSEYPGVRPPSMKKETTTEYESFNTGDCIEHKAFGKGVISQMRQMGGDFLIEIDFEKAGKKKLMLRAAAQHMHHI